MTNYNELELAAIAKVENYFKAIWTPEFTKGIVRDLKERLGKYQQENGLKSFVLGMSGGLDSAVIAALAADFNTKGMFIGINSAEEHRALAELVAKQYDIEYSEKFITEEQVKNFKSILLSTDNDRVAIGNLKARLRMIALYDLARKHGGCVLSTDNLSELQMGFWTLHGDVGDIAPIQFLNKGFEVQYVAKELGIPDAVIDQAPSDGLGVTAANTDESQLGGNYRYVDTVMFAYIQAYFAPTQGGKSTLSDVFRELLATERAQNVIKRFQNTRFKRQDNSKVFEMYTPGRDKYVKYIYFSGGGEVEE